MMEPEKPLVGKGLPKESNINIYKKFIESLSQYLTIRPEIKDVNIASRNNNFFQMIYFYLLYAVKLPGRYASIIMMCMNDRFKYIDHKVDATGLSERDAWRNFKKSIVGMNVELLLEELTHGQIIGEANKLFMPSRELYLVLMDKNPNFIDNIPKIMKFLGVIYTEDLISNDDYLFLNDYSDIFNIGVLEAYMGEIEKNGFCNVIKLPLKNESGVFYSLLREDEFSNFIAGKWGVKMDSEFINRYNNGDFVHNLYELVLDEEIKEIPTSLSELINMLFTKPEKHDIYEFENLFLGVQIRLLRFFRDKLKIKTGVEQSNKYNDILKILELNLDNPDYILYRSYFRFIETVFSVYIQRIDKKNDEFFESTLARFNDLQERIKIYKDNMNK